MILPSYDEAILSVDVPSLVVPFLDLRTQWSASLVNKAWNKAVYSCIWADPLRSVIRTAHPFYHAVRFMHKSPEHRDSLRNRITTIDYRHLLALRHRPKFAGEFAHHELWIGFNWVFQHCDLFHNLRFIILDDLTRAGEIDARDQSFSDFARSGPRILLLSAKNVPFKSIQNSISAPHFCDLLYLDLSYTCRPEELTLQRFHNLRILKLRGLRLTAIPQMVLDLGKQLWSLDVRDNLITDQSISPLFEFCFDTSLPAHTHQEDMIDSNIHTMYHDPPVYHRHEAGDSYTEYVSLRPDSMDGFVKYANENGNLQTPTHAHVLAPDDPLYVHTGLTQLYISGNRLTSTTFAKMFSRPNRLQILDIGTLRLESAQTRNQTIFAIDKGCEKITSESHCRLEGLRIHHSAVTRIPNVTRTRSGLASDLESLKQGENMYQDDDFRLDPLSHHHLTSLTLTDVPCQSYGPIIEQIINFLQDCAIQENTISALRSSMPKSRRAPPILEGLKTLRLEFLPAPATTSRSGSSDRHPDQFLSSTFGDFSFFAASGESGWEGQKESVKSENVHKEEKKAKDVVEELKSFRQAQKYEGWNGRLELVRPTSH